MAKPFKKNETGTRQKGKENACPKAPSGTAPDQSLNLSRIEFQELFHRDASFTQLVLQKPLFDRLAFVHGDGKNTGISFFGQLYMTALLAPHRPTRPLERFDNPFRF
jgi:hypothetical protein